ncbi:cell division inhibitor SidA [Phenylobacterium sp.]
MHMARLARESLAFVSVAGFVWGMCQVASLVG